MPPKYPPIPPQVPIRRPEEEPTEPNDAHDVLCVMDFVDVLDAIPVDLTKTLADLRELDAVLNATIQHVVSRLGALTDILTDTSATPCDRFQLLLEIAEELTRYKLGGEDKIRVAGNACEALVASQHHVQGLISSSTLLLQPTPSKPIHILPSSTSHKRHRNSPMPSRHAGSGSTSHAHGNGNENGSGSGVGDTPSKKKKRTHSSGLGQEVERDGEEEEGVKSPVPVTKKGGGAKDKKAQKVKATAANRMSPAESLDRFPPRSEYAQPGLARGLTPLGRHKEDDKQSRDSPGPSSHLINPNNGGFATDDLPPSRPVKAVRGGAKKPKTGSAAAAAAAAAAQAALSATGSNLANSSAGQDLGFELDENGMEVEADQKLYCSCQKPSYGEMIACDGEDCPYEWFHLACTNLTTMPVGDWLCLICSEAKATKAAAKSKGKAKGGAGAGAKGRRTAYFRK